MYALKRISMPSVTLTKPFKQYGNGEHCKKKIKISYSGKTATATIVDKVGLMHIHVHLCA